MIDLKQSVDGITLTKSFKCHEDEDSIETKTIHLKVKFTGTLNGVFHKALSPVVIAVQGKVRKHWAQYRDGQEIEVNFGAPTVTSPEDAMVARLQSMTMDEAQEYLETLMSKVRK